MVAVHQLLAGLFRLAGRQSWRLGLSSYFGAEGPGLHGGDGGSSGPGFCSRREQGAYILLERICSLLIPVHHTLPVPLVRLVSCSGHFLFAGACGYRWLGTPALPKPVPWGWEPCLMEGSHPGWLVINCNDRGAVDQRAKEPF